MNYERPRLDVGMRLYAVPVAKYYGKPGPATVVKTGRKWAQVQVGNRIDFIQFDVETWEQKPTGIGYNKEFELWPSKEEYDDFIAYVEWKREFLLYNAEKMPRAFWEKVKELYESKDWFSRD